VTGGLLAVHGHAYQPDRRDPWTELVPREPGAGQHGNWTSRITAECYAPNAERGNFTRIGWDLGPALATWLRRERREIHDAIAAQAGANAMACGYHHSILPLASARDRRTEIRWALRDAELRFGRRPAGIWLPETAVDRLTLQICAEEGVRYTLLAPWQAGTDGIDTRRLYRVSLGGNRSIAICFYDGLLSAAVSFEPAATEDAERFVAERARPRLSEPLPDGSAPLAVVATDLELYGHHQKFRDLFLERLTKREGAERAAGAPTLTSVGDLLASERRPTLPEMTVRERTSWSCHHGVARWSAECPDAADGRWKNPLRAAFDRLAAAIDAVSEAEVAGTGLDLWAARDRYVDVASEYAEEGEWLSRELGSSARGEAAGRRAAARRMEGRLATLLRAQRSRLRMFASDGWFWDDPTRIETAQVLRFAAHAARLVDGLAGTALERRLVEDLGALRSPATGASGAQIYAAALKAVDQPAPRP
jgi:hypothetical protein